MKISIIQTIFCLYAMVACGNGKITEQDDYDKMCSDTRVEIYNYASSVTPSTLYSVRINGNSTLVYRTIEPQIASFGCDGMVKIEVDYQKENISTVAIRPVSKNHHYTFDKGRITLYLNPYDQVSVEINGDETNPLFLFANPLEADNRPSKDDPNVKYYAAGQTYDAGTIQMSSGQTLYVEGGAVVYGVAAAHTRQNVTIAGCGIIDAQTNPAYAVKMEYCDSLKISDVCLLNRDGWSCAISCCNNVDLHNFKVIAPASTTNPNGIDNGGIDLLGCNNATAKYCFAYAHDDAFMVKTRKWNWGSDVENISFEECIGWNIDAGNTFEIGYELNDKVRNVSFKNIYAIHSGTRNEMRRGALTIHQAAGGSIENVRYENVYVEDPKEYGLYIRILKSVYNIGNGVEWTPGKIDGVIIKNLVFLKQPPRGHVLQGLNDGENRIKGLEIENMTTEGAKVTSGNAVEGFKFYIVNTDVTFK